MSKDTCPNCGSNKTVRHSATATLKPNWLHCNGCARCAPTDGLPAAGVEGATELASDDSEPPAAAEEEHEADKKLTKARRRH